MTAKWKNRIIEQGMCDPNDLNLNPNNWREHPKFQRESMNAVLDEIGWVQSVIVNKTTGNLIDGHLRVEEARKKGEQVPYLIVDLTEEEEKLLLSVFDPITGLADTNKEILQNLMEEIHTDNDNLNDLLENIRSTNKIDINLTVDLSGFGKQDNRDIRYRVVVDNLDLEEAEDLSKEVTKSRIEQYRA